MFYKIRTLRWYWFSFNPPTVRWSTMAKHWPFIEKWPHDAVLRILWNVLQFDNIYAAQCLFQQSKGRWGLSVCLSVRPSLSVWWRRCDDDLVDFFVDLRLLSKEEWKGNLLNVELVEDRLMVLQLDICILQHYNKHSGKNMYAKSISRFVCRMCQFIQHLVIILLKSN